MVVIAEDASNVPKLLKVDGNQYLYVNVSNMPEVPVVERKVGSDCTLTDGVTNRVLTLSNPSLSKKEIVYLDGVALKQVTDYTVTHAATSSTIEFLVKVWDTQHIIVSYFI